jgi:hypothetical protein
VEVVVLHRLREVVGGELAAQRRKARRKPPQPAELVALQRQVAPQEVLVARRQRRHPQVRDAVGEVVVGVGGLAALQLGVARQHSQPRLRWVADLADRGASVGQQQPRPLLVVGEDLGDPVGPPGEQCGRQPRLERLHRTARLEPGNALGERYAQHRRRETPKRSEPTSKRCCSCGSVHCGSCHRLSEHPFAGPGVGPAG